VQIAALKAATVVPISAPKHQRKLSAVLLGMKYSARFDPDDAGASGAARKLRQLETLGAGRQIPPGKVASYGQIALLIPPPMGVDFDSYKAFAPRWVGGAMAACPDDVPWQRVINSQGRISERPGAERQRMLLEEEGVQFNQGGRIDLKIFGWQSSFEEPEQPPLL